MKWIVIELDRNGKEYPMPYEYNTREEAEKNREIFYSVNPHKTCRIRQVEEEKG